MTKALTDDSGAPPQAASKEQPKHAPLKPARRLTARKLLVASIGVASVNYALSCNGAGSDGFFTTSANLLAPPPRADGGKPPAKRDAGVNVTTPVPTTPKAKDTGSTANPDDQVDAGEGDDDEADAGEPGAD